LGGRERGVEIGCQSLVGPVRRGRQGADDEVGTGRQLPEAVPYQVSQPPLDAVALDGASDRLGYDEPGARTSGAGFGRKHQVDDERSAGGPAARSYRRGELTATPEALRGGQHPTLQ
jgi:hypothetical protein